MATTQKKKLKNGTFSYRFTVSLGYDLNNKQLRSTTTWTSEPGMTERQADKEALRQSVLFEEQCKTQMVCGGNIKLADFAEQWFKDYAQQQLKPGTVATYRTFLPRINAALGHIRLDKLTPKHLLSFYENLSDEEIRLDIKYRSKDNFKQLLAKRGYTQSAFCKEHSIGHGIVESLCTGKNISQASAEKVAAALSMPISKFLEPVNRGALSGKTKLHYHRFLSAMLETAVQWQMIISNPCKRVKAPRAKKVETAYLDEYQVAELIAALNQEPIQYRAMVLMILNTGLRRGELCALSWSDIDLDRAVLSVRQNAVYLPGQGVVLDTPKTASSKRSIKLPQPVIPMMKQYRSWLAEHRLQLGDLWQDQNLVFPGWDGSPMRPDTLTNWFSNFIRRHDLPHVTIHGLRHTNATLLIAAGTNLRTVSGRLGHSQASTTANIYAHAIQSADAAAAEILGDILSPKKKQA